MAALPRILSTADLPAVELRALELDSQLRRIGQRWCVPDVLATPNDRLVALGLAASSRLIADRGSAAWVWGATHEPPDPVTCCVTPGARARPAIGSGLSVREARAERHELVRLLSGTVTTPLRTVVDLARLTERWTADDDALLRRLAVIGRFSAADALATLPASRRLAGARIARRRVERALSPS